MVEKRIRRRSIVAPDSDPQSPGLNQLDRVIERNHVVRRTSLIRLVRRHRLTFVLVGKAGYFHIAKLELPHQTFENHQTFRALHSIVIEMSVGGKNDINTDGGKVPPEPLRVTTGRI